MCFFDTQDLAILYFKINPNLLGESGYDRGKLICVIERNAVERGKLLLIFQIAIDIAIETYISKCQLNK